MLLHALGFRAQEKRESSTNHLSKARRKVRIASIANNSSRKASLKIRSRGSLNRVSESGNRCGVSASVFVCSPDGNKLIFRTPPRSKVEHLLGQHQSVREMERSRKTMNQERYLKERNAIAVQQKKMLKKENKDSENIHLVRQFHMSGKTTNGFATSEMHRLFDYAQEGKKEIKKRIEFLEQANGALRWGHAPLPIEGSVGEKEMTLEGKGGNGENKGSIGDASSPWGKWFSDMMKHSRNATGDSNNKEDALATFGKEQAETMVSHVRDIFRKFCILSLTSPS